MFIENKQANVMQPKKLVNEAVDQTWMESCIQLLAPRNCDNACHFAKASCALLNQSKCPKFWMSTWATERASKAWAAVSNPTSPPEDAHAWCHSVRTICAGVHTACCFSGFAFFTEPWLELEADEELEVDLAGDSERRLLKDEMSNKVFVMASESTYL